MQCVNNHYFSTLNKIFGSGPKKHGLTFLEHVLESEKGFQKLSNHEKNVSFYNRVIHSLVYFSQLGNHFVLKFCQIYC